MIRLTMSKALVLQHSPQFSAGRVIPVLRDFGIPPRFLDHASRAEVMTEIGLTAPDIARQVTGLVSKLDGRFNREAAEVDSVEPARD